MGIDLYGEGGYLRLSFDEWADAHMLALLHGWQPEGTWVTLEDGSLGPSFGDDYWSNGGQTVSCQDARNLAAALQRALAKLGDTREQQKAEIFPPLGPAVLRHRLRVDREGLKAQLCLAEEEIDRIVEALIEDWPGLSGEAVLDLVALCKQGSFAIC